jgi:hypothetical protein
MQLLRFELSIIGVQMGLASGGLSGGFSLAGISYRVVPFGDGFAVAAGSESPIVFVCRDALLAWLILPSPKGTGILEQPKYGLSKVNGFDAKQESNKKRLSLD